ncbi:preprotein translocase subunit SecB [Tangfeifania diversioriginum]|uniref:Preprotein translocase subunit SecB n=1 Tax=Tangfeifania diversioriginum TaxID=1168035 RepID=A0A1M6KEP2_9BACT|nr:protein-export chaperone SecB [Tangfeifania diversioriginum]SHJ57297.1 preprotein translocase subunit SecB [Tangfeifania diversioriginum]
MKNGQISQAPFRLKNFFFSESSIKIEPSTKAQSIDISIQPQGLVNESEKTFELELFVNIESKDGLKISIKLIGTFEFKEVVKNENLSNYFFVNAPAIIFPYLRSYISALTALSGSKTIILPPMNMSSLGKQLEENTTRKE